ncbi:hypothetical protein BDQ12DRAFT_318843 [Crucibulum laeve]|uniref:F-box domain-containing protein n=1 Tax=Crucibulum laeve TaxID=68775 RepID=A0A5C3LQZ2_9AGAR|nr:hypothetical protein BDQ12DRAFT_318843 [Crucibulum laeve]
MGHAASHLESNDLEPNYLPFEILDLIFSYADRATLLSCLLLCHGLRPSVYKNIFGPHLVVTPAQLLRVITLSCTNRAARRAISYYTKILTVDSKAGCAKVPLPSWDAEQLKDLFGNVGVVELIGIDFGTFPLFTQFICAFPALHSISLSDLAWVRTDDPYGAGAIRYEHLVERSFTVSRLNIDTRNFIEVVRWLRAHKCLPSITAVHSHVQTGFHGHLFLKIMQDLSDTVQKLKLDVTFVGAVHNNLTGLVSCRNLRRLHIINPIVEQARTQRMLTTILNQIVSTQIETITFTLLIQRKKKLRHLEWKAIADILRRDVRFSRLKVIRIKLTGWQDSDECITFQPDASQILRSELAYFEKNQMLVIKFLHPY